MEAERFAQATRNFDASVERFERIFLYELPQIMARVEAAIEQAAALMDRLEEVTRKAP